MKKKIMALVVCAAMLTLAIASGTLAYFTDTDSAKNVMTTGNVSIVQNETDRNGDEFKDDQLLVPAVYSKEGLSYDGSMITPNGKTRAIWNESVANEIDKVVTVTNDGTLPAYIRTIFLYEDNVAGDLSAKMHGLWCNTDGQYRVWVQNDDGSWMTVTINGVTYTVAVCTYNTALAAGATSDPSLMQIFLDPSADNSWSNAVGEKYDILALSQAAQVDGFASATDALDTAFGKVTAENVAEWFKNVQ